MRVDKINDSTNKNKENIPEFLGVKEQKKPKIGGFLSVKGHNMYKNKTDKAFRNIVEKCSEDDDFELRGL